MSACHQAHALAHWGDLSRRVVALSNSYPLLATRLICAPMQAIHAYAIFLMYRSEWADDERLARTIHFKHPRALLQEIVPPRVV